MRIKAIKKFTIDRATWLHGEGPDDSKLVRGRDGKQCCLGFYMRACGFTRKSLVECSSPTEAVGGGNLPDPVAWLRRSDPLMKTNDGVLMSHDKREERIKRLFAEQGVKVHFVGRRKKAETET